MDLKSAIQYIGNHYVLISGSTLALFFTTAMILLIRSIGDKSERSVGGNSAIDVDAIEGAMKRVLQSQPVSIAAGTVIAASVEGQAGASVDGANPEAVSAAIREREQTIDALKDELAQAKETILQLSDKSGDGADAGEINLYKTKIEELQARLAEYEIIEDDIADLSMYKEENARFKAELEKLRAQTANLATAPAAAEAPAAEIIFEKTEKFELDPNDDVMKEFAAAVGDRQAPKPESASAVAPAAAVDEPPIDQAAIDAMLNGDAVPAAEPDASQAEIDAMLSGGGSTEPEGDNAAAVASPSADADDAVSEVLAGIPDAEKILSEVESIDAESSESSGDMLDESLDTEKLLAEVDSLKGADGGDITSEFDKASGS